MGRSPQSTWQDRSVQKWTRILDVWTYGRKLIIIARAKIIRVYTLSIDILTVRTEELVITLRKRRINIWAL